MSSSTLGTCPRGSNGDVWQNLFGDGASGEGVKNGRQRQTTPHGAKKSVLYARLDEVPAISGHRVGSALRPVDGRRTTLCQGYRIYT